MITTKPVQHFTFTHESGMHLRPAGLLAKTASRFSSDVRLWCSRGTSNAKSVLSIVMLGLMQGDEFAVFAEGADADEAMQAITSLLVSSCACCRPDLVPCGSDVQPEPQRQSAGAVA